MKLLGLLAGTMLLTLASSEMRPARQAAPSPKLDRWQPAGGAEMALWPDGVAVARPETAEPEKFTTSTKLIGGRPYSAIENVTRPTLTFYHARGANTGVTLLVFPGGGYQALAIDLEGIEVCDWATARGINCAVLKYRVPQAWWHKECHCQRPPKPFMAL